MPDKYRYSTPDILFNKGVDRLQIMAGPHSSKCFDYVDKTLKIYIRLDHKVMGPQELCRKCITGLPDAEFEKAWEKQKSGKRIIYNANEIKKREAKKAMESEMDIYRRVNI